MTSRWSQTASYSSTSRRESMPSPDEIADIRLYQFELNQRREAAGNASAYVEQLLARQNEEDVTPELRRTLPLGIDVADPEQLAGHLDADAVHQLLEHLRVVALLRRLVRGVAEFGLAVG